MTWKKAVRADIDTRVAGGFGTPAGLAKQHLRAYQAWYHARRRCTDPNHKQYKDYGGRGITMCERWTDSFAAFLQDMGDPLPGLSLDRMDNDGLYGPGNCQWATRGQQQKNKRLRTHCLKGSHEMTEANTYVERKTGKRKCRACQNEGQRRRAKAA